MIKKYQKKKISREIADHIKNKMHFSKKKKTHKKKTHFLIFMFKYIHISDLRRQIPHISYLSYASLYAIDSFS